MDLKTIASDELLKILSCEVEGVSCMHWCMRLTIETAKLVLTSLASPEDQYAALTIPSTSFGTPLQYATTQLKKKTIAEELIKVLQNPARKKELRTQVQQYSPNAQVSGSIPAYLLPIPRCRLPAVPKFKKPAIARAIAPKPVAPGIVRNDPKPLPQNNRSIPQSQFAPPKRPELPLEPLQDDNQITPKTMLEARELLLSELNRAMDPINHTRWVAAKISDAEAALLLALRKGLDLLKTQQAQATIKAINNPNYLAALQLADPEGSASEGISKTAANELTVGVFEEQLFPNANDSNSSSKGMFPGFNNAIQQSTTTKMGLGSGAMLKPAAIGQKNR
jgi:hypothetical protein